MILCMTVTQDLCGYRTRYSHKRVDTKSVSSIAKQMIDYAIDYLEEVKASAKKSAGAPETDDIRLPREAKHKITVGFSASSSSA